MERIDITKDIEDRAHGLILDRIAGLVATEQTNGIPIKVNRPNTFLWRKAFEVLTHQGKFVLRKILNALPASPI